MEWQFYPRSKPIPERLQEIVDVFNSHSDQIRKKYESTDGDRSESNDILAIVRDDLLSIGIEVEKGKTSDKKKKIPVLFKRNGETRKTYDADGYDPKSHTVIEVEAGRAVVNNQFLKDLFEACVMQDIDYLVIAVRLVYKKRRDFDYVDGCLDTLYSSDRLVLPLKGILIIGY
jgi:hypothetical protein